MDECRGEMGGDPQRRRSGDVIEHGKKIVRIVSGCSLLVVGIALSLPGIPGPGIAVVILGLSVLSTDFEFARRWMTRLKTGDRKSVALPILAPKRRMERMVKGYFIK